MDGGVKWNMPPLPFLVRYPRPLSLSLPFSLNSYLFINYCLGIMEGIFDGI